LFVIEGIRNGFYTDMYKDWLHVKKWTYLWWVCLFCDSYTILT
jgi:hypothetical protein